MKRKVIFFNQSREIGGTDTFIFNLIKYWPAEEGELVVWCNKGHKGIGLYQKLPIISEEIRFPVLSQLYGLIDKYRVHKFLVKLYKILIFVIVKPALFIISVFFFYKKLNLQKPDAIFSSNGGYPGGELCQSLVIAARLAKVKKIFLIIHSNAYKSIFPFRLWEYIFIDRLISWACSEIVSVSKACVNNLENSCNFNRYLKLIYQGIPAGKIDGQSLEEKREKLEIEPQDIVIGSVGNYEERKGQQYLIRAFAKVKADFPRAKLFIIGSDGFPEREHLENIKRDLNLDKSVYLTGYLPAAAEYMECFNILVHPSVFDESFGIVLLEAMFYKKPVIATLVGGIPEVIGDAGIIVEPGDSEILAEKIIFLLRNPEIAKAIGENGYRRLKEKFGINEMVRKYYELTLN